MMKVIAIFFIVFLCCCQNDVSKREITEKARRIRAELIDPKSLSPKIQKAHWGDEPPSNFYMFDYNTTRKENNNIDSVWIQVRVNIDSLEHLSFHEMHFKNNKEDKSYLYQVNKYGVIDWAYKTNPPTSEPAMIEKNDSVLITPSNQPIIEINTDSSNSFFPFKNPDEKTTTFYNSKLITSLDELDKILFPK